MGYSKNKEAAKEFIKYLMEYKNYAEWLRAGQGFSTAPTRNFAQDKLWGELDPQVEPFKDIEVRPPLWLWRRPAARPPKPGQSTLLWTCSPRPCRGRPPRTPLSWATGELKKVYET